MADENATGAEAIISDEPQLETLRESIDDPQVLKAQLAKEAEARRQLTARAKKAEEALKAIKPADTETQTTSVTQTQTSSADVDAKIWEVADLIRQGFTKQDAEFLQANGGKAALQNPNSYASIALKGVMEQRKAELAAAQTDTSGGEDRLSTVSFNLPRNAGIKDLKASIEAMEKALPHAE